MGYVGSGRPVGRPKQFYKYELPHGVIKVVSAQCADYKRKQLAISEGALSQEILDAYIATNAAIDKALDDIEENWEYMNEENYEIKNQLEKRKDFLEFLLNYA